MAAGIYQLSIDMSWEGNCFGRSRGPRFWVIASGFEGWVSELRRPGLLATSRNLLEVCRQVLEIANDK